MYAVSVAVFRIGPEVRMNGQRISEYFEPDIIVVQSEYVSYIVQTGNMGITLLLGLRHPAAQKHLRQLLGLHTKVIGPQISQTCIEHFFYVRCGCREPRKKRYWNRNAELADTPHELVRSALFVAIIKHQIALLDKQIVKLFRVTAIRCFVKNNIAVGGSDKPIAMRNRRTRTASFIASQVCGRNDRDGLYLRACFPGCDNPCCKARFSLGSRRHQDTQASVATGVIIECVIDEIRVVAIIPEPAQKTDGIRNLRHAHADNAENLTVSQFREMMDADRI